MVLVALHRVCGRLASYYGLGTRGPAALIHYAIGEPSQRTNHKLSPIIYKLN